MIYHTWGEHANYYTTDVVKVSKYEKKHFLLMNILYKPVYHR